MNTHFNTHRKHLFVVPSLALAWPTNHTKGSDTFGKRAGTSRRIKGVQLATHVLEVLLVVGDRDGGHRLARLSCFGAIGIHFDRQMPA